MKSKRHPNARAIVAWALGQDVQYRTQFRDGAWTAWMAVPKDAFKFDVSLRTEYRVKPRVEPPMNQQYEAAYYAGRTVMARHRYAEDREWRKLTPEVLSCTVNPPVWERAWVEFKILDH